MEAKDKQSVTSLFTNNFNDNESWPTLNKDAILTTPLLNGKTLFFETSLPVDSSNNKYYDAINSKGQDHNLTSSLIQCKSDSDFSRGTFHSSSKSPPLVRSSSQNLSLDFSFSGEQFEKQEKKCTNFQAFMILLRANTGPGILSLPAAFKYGGLWLGLGCFLLIALVAIESFHNVIRCSTELERRYGIRTRNFAEVAEYTFFYGHPRIKKYSKFARHFSNSLMQFMQCGVCCVYFVFIATNIEKVINSYWTSGPSVRVYEICVYILVLPYLMVKNLRSLSFFSFFANILYVLGLVLIFQYILQDIPSVSQRQAVGDWATLPLFFGTSLFAYEGVNIVTPVRNSMKTPEDLDGKAGVLNLCMVLLTSLYTAGGFYGYLKFGEATEGSVTLNLPQGDWLSISVDCIFSVMVFFSMGVQFYISIDVIWPAVEQKLESRWDMTSRVMASLVTKRFLAYCLTRFVLITLILIVALLVPHIELLISLVGALLGTMMAIVMPGILDLVRRQAMNEMTSYSTIKNISIICFGIVGLVTGTYTSLVDIIHTF